MSTACSEHGDDATTHTHDKAAEDVVRQAKITKAQCVIVNKLGKPKEEGVADSKWAEQLRAAIQAELRVLRTVGAGVVDLMPALRGRVKRIMEGR